MRPADDYKWGPQRQGRQLAGLSVWVWVALAAGMLGMAIVTAATVLGR